MTRKMRATMMAEPKDDRSPMTMPSRGVVMLGLWCSRIEGETSEIQAWDVSVTESPHSSGRALAQETNPDAVSKEKWNTSTI